VGIPFVVTVEKTPQEYIASCEELRAVASGATEDEALANLKLAIRALLSQYGHELELAGKRRVVVEVG
jgi:predicted RNase H-like HicB family nuclease